MQKLRFLQFLRKNEAINCRWSSRRCIYSAKFLTVSEEKCGRNPELEDKLLKKMDASGSESLTRKDISYLIYNLDNGGKVKTLLTEVLNQPERFLNHKKHYCKAFMDRCFIANDAQLASEFMQCMTSQADLQMVINKPLPIYLTLQHKNGLYEEVLRSYERIFEASPESNLDSALMTCNVALASLYCLGTPEAFAKGLEIFSLMESREVVKKSRIPLFLAGLALKLKKVAFVIDFLEMEKYGLAMEGVAMLSHAYTLNHDVQAAIETLDEAASHAQSGKFGKFKKLVIYEAYLNALTQAVKDSKDPQLVDKFSKLCVKLDDYGTMANIDMESYLLRDIEKKANAK